jgi:hypothetical protein
MCELTLNLFEVTEERVRLTVSADLSQLPVWRMFADCLEGLPGVEAAVLRRYSVDLRTASWIASNEVLAGEIGDEVFTSDIVKRLFEQRIVPILSVTYIDDILNIRGHWETPHVH